MNRLLDKAIEYARRGWFVFPTREKQTVWHKDGKDILLKVKSPYVKGGFEVATRDESQIKAWWYKYPTAGIGVACGASGLVVVDIDVKDGRDGLNNFMSMNISDEGALHATTPSGGLHLVYTGNIHSQANVKIGVDVRGIGAYFVAPPSGIYDKEMKMNYYTAVDDWSRTPAQIPESFVSQLDVLKNREFVQVERKIVNEDIKVTIEKAKKALYSLPQEFYEDYFKWVNVGLALYELGEDGLNLWDEWSKQSDKTKGNKYEPNACRERWGKMKPRKISIGSLFFWAKEYNKHD
jgi:hypothetical protein